MTKKFRVWNNVQKIWINPDEIGISANGNILILSSQGESESVWDYDCWNGNRIYDMQQWTGLTDSQGVEIYEGDFIKAGAIKGAVNFYKSAYYINEQLLVDAYVLLAGNIKIIGNIFQNPELLEKC